MKDKEIKRLLKRAGIKKLNQQVSLLLSLMENFKEKGYSETAQAERIVLTAENIKIVIIGMGFIFGDAKTREANWLCPNCKRRPPGNAIKIKNGKAYCIYCDAELNFSEEVKK